MDIERIQRVEDKIQKRETKENIRNESHISTPVDPSRPIIFEQGLKINPLIPIPPRQKQTREKKVLLHISSSDRNTIVNAESHEYTLKITPARTNVKFIELVSVELPFTFYPIRDIENIIYFDDSGGTPRTAIITPGSYSIKNFLVELKTEMEASGTSDTFTITKNDNTKRLTITNDAGVFELTTSNNTNAIWKIIGYDFGLVDLTGSASYEAPSIWNMSGRQHVYIVSDLTDSLNDDIIESSGQRPIIAKVPVSVSFKETIHFEPFERIKLGFSALILSSIKVTIVDPDFIPHDLHKVDFSMSFLLTEIRPQ